MQETLATVDPNQSDHVTMRLVDATVDTALAPWKRKADVQKTIQSAMNRFHYEVGCIMDSAGLKQSAWEAGCGPAAGARLF